VTSTLTRSSDEQLSVPDLDETLTPSQRFLIVTLVAVVALNAGYQFAVGGSLYLAIAPAAVLIGVGVGLLALVNFEAFILVLLFGRALLDFSRGKVERSLGATTSSGPWAAAASAVLVIAGLLWLAAPRVRAKRSTAEWAMVAFVAACLLSVLASDQPSRSIVEVARVMAAVVMFAVVRRLVQGNPKVADRVLTAAFASAIIPLGVAAFQMFAGSGGFQSGGYSRVRGTFVHPNPFAFYLTLLVTMGVALFPHLRGWRQLALGAIIAASTGALLATYTRTGWLALFVALLVVAVLQTRWLIPVMLCAVVLVVALVPSISGRFSDLGETRTASGAPSNSLIWRVDYWKQAIDLADRNPVLGIGLKMTQSATDEAKAPHNDVIRAYAETGVLGLGAYLAMVGALITIAFTALRNASAGRERGIAVGFAGCVVAFCLFSLVSNVASQVVLLWYFFAFAAVATAIGTPEAGAGPSRQ
jgi:O-antigen ligase